MPSFMKVARTALGTAADVVKGQLAGNPLIASDAKYEARMAICNGCPKKIEVIKNAPQCGECKCFLGAKLKLEASTCPDGKW